MKTIALTVFLGSALSVGMFAESMTGFMSDAHCGAKHDSASAANTKCAETCVKKGADPVLVSNGKVIKFDADSKAQAVAHVGQEVKVDGTMDGDMLKINSIEEAK